MVAEHAIWSTEYAMFKRTGNPQYSRLRLRINIRRVRKIFFNVQTLLDLHTNYFRSSFILQRSDRNSLRVVKVNNWILKIFCILYRCSNARAIDCKFPVLETTDDCHNNIVNRKSMLDGGTNCGKGDNNGSCTWSGVPLVAQFLVRPDHLRHGQPTAWTTYGVTVHTF